MAGGARWLPILLALIAGLQFSGLAAAEEGAQPSVTTEAPKPVTEDAIRLLEMGKLLMGENNPAYARAAVKLDAATRNAAEAQALGIFQRVVKQYPSYAEGWLWLGIALCEALQYSPEHPDGEPARTEASTTEGLQCFRTAWELSPSDLVTVSFYCESLVTYRRDFPLARKIWECFYPVARTDMQRVMALTQCARACLNQAYFGKAEKMPAEEVKALYLAAQSYLDRAAKLCPNCQDVKEMQELLRKYRKELCEK